MYCIVRTVRTYVVVVVIVLLMMSLIRILDYGTVRTVPVPYGSLDYHTAGRIKCYCRIAFFYYRTLTSQIIACYEK